MKYLVNSSPFSVARARKSLQARAIDWARLRSVVALLQRHIGLHAPHIHEYNIMIVVTIAYNVLLPITTLKSENLRLRATSSLLQHSAPIRWKASL